MKLENTFEVPASPDVVWAFLLDVEKIAPCMPGAELTEVVDPDTYKGKVNMKLGPVSLSYKGTVNISEKDEAARRASLDAKGTEMRGKGTASAKVTAVLEPTDGGGTRTVITTNLTLTGAAAQYGRGMLGDISQKLTGEFADCLAKKLTEGSGGDGEETTGEGPAAGTPQTGTAAAPPREVAKPVSGIRLFLWALVRAIGRLFARVWRAITGRRGR